MTTPSKPDLVALATCPFCGGPAHSTKEVVSADLAALVMCTDNDCATISAPTLADATKRWNTRHLASQPSSYEADRETKPDDGAYTDDPRLARPIAALPADGGEESAGCAVIEGDAVVIRFPLDAMQTAMDGAWSLRAFDTRYKITDINEFSKEFTRALNREDERGTTEIHKMADRAFIDCIENGAFGIEEHEQQDL